ncbi:MAG: DMT family transporter [Myxococcota bacterium]
MIPIALALASSVAWSSFDAARKSLSARIHTIPLVVLLVFGQCPVFFAWWGLSGFGEVGSAFWLPATVDLALNLIANVLFIQSVRLGELSATVPLLSLTPIFSLGIAAGLLDEYPDGTAVTGIVFVVAGAVGLHLGVPRKGGWLAAGLMLAVAALWSITAALDKIALAVAPVPFHALYQCIGIALTLSVYLVASGRSSELRAVRSLVGPWALAVGTAVLALGLQLLAIKMIYVSFMEAFKRAVGIVGALVYGRVFFAEPITGRKLGSVAAITTGVLLIILS